MENFFLDDRFCSDLEDLANKLEIDEDNIKDLEDDWIMKVELTNLEPIFKVDAEILCQLLAYANEDRLSEDYTEKKTILQALKESVDFEKLTEMLPKKHYMNGNFKTITKYDLVDWFS